MGELVSKYRLPDGMALMKLFYVFIAERFGAKGIATINRVEVRGFYATSIPLSF